MVKNLIMSCTAALVLTGCVASSPTLSTTLRGQNNQPVNALYTKLYEGMADTSSGFVRVHEGVNLVSLEKEFRSPETYVTYPAGQYIGAFQKTMEKDPKVLKTYNNKIEVSIDGKKETVYCGKNERYDVHQFKNYYYHYSETVCEVDKDLIKKMMGAQSELSVTVSYSEGGKKILPLNLETLPDLQQHVDFRVQGNY